MKRKEFIKFASTSAISLSSLGHLSFNLFREPFLNFLLLNGPSIKVLDMDQCHRIVLQKLLKI